MAISPARLTINAPFTNTDSPRSGVGTVIVIWPDVGSGPAESAVDVGSGSGEPAVEEGPDVWAGGEDMVHLGFDEAGRPGSFRHRHGSDSPGNRLRAPSMSRGRVGRPDGLRLRQVSD